MGSPVTEKGQPQINLSFMVPFSPSLPLPDFSSLCSWSVCSVLKQRKININHSFMVLLCILLLVLHTLGRLYMFVIIVILNIIWRRTYWISVFLALSHTHKHTHNYILHVHKTGRNVVAADDTKLTIMQTLTRVFKSSEIPNTLKIRFFIQSVISFHVKCNE